MKIDTWYQWLLVYGYEVGQLLFLVALLILSLKIRRPTIIVSTFAFLIFVLGNAQMFAASREYTESAQQGVAQIPLNETAAWLQGRIRSSIGFFVSGAALLWFGIANGRRNTLGEEKIA